MIFVKQNDTSKKAVLFMADASTPTSGKTGLTVVAVRLSKNGAAFGAGGGSVAELEGGFYAYTYAAGDTDTLGTLAIRATAAGAVDFVGVRQVVSFDPYDATRLGLTALPNFAAGAAGGLPTGDASGRVTVGGYAGGQDPATLVLDVAAAGHNAAGSIGAKINASGSAGDPLTNLATAYTADQIGWRIAQTYSRLSAVSVTFVGPVAQASGLTTLIQGDDYRNADGRALLFADAGGTWPDLTGGTVRLLSYPPGGSGLSVVGTILAAGTASQQARFDLTAAQTSAAALGGYPYHVTAVLASGDVVTLVTGTLIVVQT